jgi:hypothetical protein
MHTEFPNIEICESVTQLNTLVSVTEQDVLRKVPNHQINGVQVPNLAWQKEENLIPEILEFFTSTCTKYSNKYLCSQD